MTTKRVLLRADARKAQIVDAAIGVFAGRGYEGTTVEGLARAAGIDKVLIYRHFGGQRGLFAAVVDEASARAGEFAADVMGRTGGKGTPEAVLVEIVRGMRANPEVLGVLGLSPSDPDARAILDVRRRTLADRFRTLMYEARADEVSRLTPHQRAWLGDLVLGALTEALGNHVRTDPARTDREFAEFVARGIRMSVDAFLEAAPAP